ncbi:MAG: hypothetical protein ACLFR0_03430 [Alphaproteobacteria bacterium]
MIWEPLVLPPLRAEGNNFITDIRRGMQCIPEELQEKFAAAGHKLIIARNLADASDLLPVTRAYLKETQNIDICEGLKAFNKNKGAFFQYDNHIVIPQSASGTVSDHIWGITPQYIAAHEIGHLFDCTSIPDSFLSAEQDFIQIAAPELQAVKKMRQLLLTPNGANIINAIADEKPFVALQEVFADLFADTMLEQNTMRRFFPESAAWIADKIDEQAANIRGSLTPAESSPSPIAAVA